MRGAAARRRGGHRLLPGHPAPRVRPGDRAPGGRRHQAGQGQLRRRRTGRDRAQDDRRDEPGHPGPGHQARRPAAQHADPAPPPPGEAGADQPGDAGDLRPAGAPARHEHGQVGAGGPGVRDPEPQGLQRDRPPRRRARPQPGRVPGRGRRAGPRRAARGPDTRHRERAPEALLLRVPEDDRARPGLRGDLRPRRDPGAGGDRARLLRGARGDARPLVPGAGPVQGLHRDAEVHPLPVAAHHRGGAGGQAGRAADPHFRDAPPRRVRGRRALEVQGGPRRTGR